MDELLALVDTEIGVGEWHTVTQEQVNQFADATLDHQWIHIDAEKAAAGPFGTTIAHGFLTLSMLVALAPSAEIPGVRMAINYGLDRVRFISPVPVGSRIRARSVLKDVHEAGGGIQTKNEVTVEIEGQEKPALVAEWLGRFYV
ncbi:MAG: MaoC family dehydratase [Acidimicrobiia bacterium]|nr:MaoC family dehydratase [Acidimicrobiia bacterium]